MTFHIYESGDKFLQDNQKVLEDNPVETSFFKINAKNMQDMTNDFAVKFKENNKFIIALRFKHYPMIIFGDNSIIHAFSVNLLQHDLTFDRILAKEPIAKSFIECYEQLNGGSHELIHSMDIMVCTQISQNNTDTTAVEIAQINDVQEIAELVHTFFLKINNKADPISKYLEEVKSNINNYVLIRSDGKIVSIAKKCREDEHICSISNVYTLNEYRCRGFSRKIMTFLTKQILESGKIVYLYVDKSNPISNHLYSSIGYKYISPQMEIKYLPDNKK